MHSFFVFLLMDGCLRISKDLDGLTEDDADSDDAISPKTTRY